MSDWKLSRVRKATSEETGPRERSDPSASGRTGPSAHHHRAGAQPARRLAGIWSAARAGRDGDYGLALVALARCAQGGIGHRRRGACGTSLTGVPRRRTAFVVPTDTALRESWNRRGLLRDAEPREQTQRNGQRRARSDGRVIREAAEAHQTRPVRRGFASVTSSPSSDSGRGPLFLYAALFDTRLLALKILRARPRQRRRNRLPPGVVAGLACSGRGGSRGTATRRRSATAGLYDAAGVEQCRAGQCRGAAATGQGAAARTLRAARRRDERRHVRDPRRRASRVAACWSSFRRFGGPRNTRRPTI